MPEPPGYIVENTAGVRPIEGVETSLAVFIGTAPSGPVGEPTEVVSAREAGHHFGGVEHSLGLALAQYFANGGARAIVLRVPGNGSAEALVGGLAGLELVDYFGLLCIPETAALHEQEAKLVARAALAVCRQRRGFYLLDAPHTLTKDTIADWADSLHASSFGAVYFPPLRVADPLQPDRPRLVGAGACVAGVFARTDRNRGVWKAPAGIEATIQGADLHEVLTDQENGVLNPRGINVLRRFPSGVTVWGSRTLRGADALSDDYKYVPVRRLASFLEESLLRGTRWTVFEPNAEPLWAQLRLQAGAFLQSLFRQGAFQGTTPRDAYYVRCDASTTTAADIAAGKLHLHLGFAPLKPAEFIHTTLTLTAAPP
jgi:phage tail sheath protein FI